MTHRRTDPACRDHHQPRTRLGWWWFDLHRGLACGPCQLERARGAFGPAGARP